jgi:hypothetical protein
LLCGLDWGRCGVVVQAALAHNSEGLELKLSDFAGRGSASVYEVEDEVNMKLKALFHGNCERLAKVDRP